MKKIILVFVSFLFLNTMFYCQTDVKKYEIKDNWQFRQKDKSNWMPASVPGCVHTDLINNKIIEDPFYGINEIKQQWIGEVDWIYQTSFIIPDDILNRKNIEMIFKGLDTYADVYLNDSLILSADNMFREWKINSKTLLQKKNKLEIYFRNVFDENIPKWKNAPFRLMAFPNNDQADTMVALYSRKAQYHYGWDWGPRLVTAGVWRPVIVEAWDDLRINNIFLWNKNVHNDKAELSSVVELESNADQKAAIQIFTENNILAEKEIALTKGTNSVDFDFIVEHPELWWPNGLGEQHLYDFMFKVKTATAADEKAVRTGIRTLELIREKDSVGTSFFVKLNGVPVFMKGANYIPLDNFQNRVTPEKYEYYIRSAAEANMNMLRIWGGGIYEEDTFYEMCDKYGILLWQDFMFACAMYPGDDKFMESVRFEVIDNVKRIRNHPSLALYCGNNENQVGWNNWGWKQLYPAEVQAQYEKDMNKLFLEVIPGAIKENDPTRFYSFSSPSAGFLNHTYMDGDIHYWGVWHGKEPFEDYDKNIARFLSEYGFQSYPGINSIRKFTAPEDRDIDSPVMLSHQRCMSDNRKDKKYGNRLIKHYMEQYFRNPKNFEYYLYVSQLVQAKGMTMAIEAHRRNKPVCMGSLFWQLNDCWPVASWSSIDYYGSWKAVHYAAKKAYNEVIIAPVDAGDNINLFIVSDMLNNVDGKISVNVMDFKGKKIFSREYPVQVLGNCSKIYAQLKKDELMAGKDSEELVLSAKLKSADQILTEKIFYFERPKELELEKPEIKLSIKKNEDGYSVEVTTDKLAKDVYLRTDDDLQFSDNFFDLLPGEKKVVNVRTGSKLGDIHVVSLADTF